jgi:hypothetical protein
MSNQDKKSSLLIYVKDFIEKHDLTHNFDNDSVVIQTNEEDLVSRIDNSFFCKKNSYLILIE